MIQDVVRVVPADPAPMNSSAELQSFLAQKENTLRDLKDSTSGDVPPVSIIGSS